MIRQRVTYNPRNYYTKVAAMQEEYLAHGNSGRTELYIYRTFIYPRFYISRSTFYRWLTINPSRELAKLDDTDRRHQYQQKQLF